VESVKQENPSIDYSPCSISNENAVVCDIVPLGEIQTLFQRTSIPILASANLILQPSIFNETFIPEDVFTVNVIDCTHLDLGFLSGFDQLTQLNLFNINNIQHCLPSLPSLPKLTSLDLEYCTGLNYLNIFPTLTNGLKRFYFWGDDNNIHTIYNDETVDRIMDWLLLFSVNTLEEMKITYMNQVTQVPHKITSFKALRKVWLPYNKISIIKSEAFSFSVPVFELNIHGNGIKEIEPGAFHGTHDTSIYNYTKINILRILKYTF